MIQTHPFHLVQLRPWPILTSITVASLLLSIVEWFHLNTTYSIILPILTGLLILTNWWKNVRSEATYRGSHRIYAQEGLEWGIIIFIGSEILFFFAFFWTFYHRRLAPNIEIGIRWPPYIVYPLDPFSVPLLNTIVLLISGATVTLAHNSLCDTSPDLSTSKYVETNSTLFITISLGVYFTLLQKEEYLSTSFTIRDRIYGSVFFIATGFHGLHVIIGAMFLTIVLTRTLKSQLSATHHFGFEAASWYWHFVDVVWIFLYINLYWWRRRG